jgi:hypothetical protein
MITTDFNTLEEIFAFIDHYHPFDTYDTPDPYIDHNGICTVHDLPVFEIPYGYKLAPGYCSTHEMRVWVIDLSIQPEEDTYEQFQWSE